MVRTNLTKDVGQDTQTLENIVCVAGWKDDINNHLMIIGTTNIFLSFLAFLGNTLILVALSKESSLHPPAKLLYRCLAITDLCVGLISEPSSVVYWLSLVREDWKLCHHALKMSFLSYYILSLVSLLTMTAISVDRLLALLLGQRFGHAVTLKRTCVIVVIIWAFSITAGISHFINYRVAGWCSYGVVSLCIKTATLSYIKIFCALRQNHLRGQVFFLPQPGKPVPLNMIRYRKAVNSALWVQLALIVCYLPYSIATGLFQSQNELSSLEFVVLESTVTLVYLNSSLNPFLYCWKIAEVRKAVKETISKALSSLLGYSIQNN